MFLEKYVGGDNVAVASSNTPGLVKPDGDTISLDNDGTIHAAINSVNGKTGTVVLNATDVGALSNNIAVPSKTSDLTNDSHFVVDASYVHTDNNYDNTAKGIVNGVTSALSSKQDVIQVLTMPTASSNNLGKIVQYIGADISDSYQHGYYYECILDNSIYSWDSINVQPGDNNLNTKADKVTNAVAGDFAGLDSNGNLIDSGYKSADYFTRNEVAQLFVKANDLTAYYLTFIGNADAKITLTETNQQNPISISFNMLSTGRYVDLFFFHKDASLGMYINDVYETTITLNAYINTFAFSAAIELVPKLTSDDGHVISSPNHYGYYDDFWVFNRDNNGSNQSWAVSGNYNVNPAYIGYHFDNPVTVTKIYVMNRTDSAPRTPKTFKLQYSDDGSTWVDNSSEEYTIPNNNAGTETNFTLETSSGYHQYWRIYILSVYDTSFMGIGRLQFYGFSE